MLLASVVCLTSTVPQNHSFGSGFLVGDSEHSLLLVTCMHVLEMIGGLDRIAVDGTPLTGALISGREKGRGDWALVSSPGLHGLNKGCIPVNYARPIKVPARVSLLGATRNTNGDGNGKIIGQLSGRVANVALLKVLGPVRPDVTMLQLTLDPIGGGTMPPELPEGFSGGPVLDLETNQVIGITMARAGEDPRPNLRYHLALDVASVLADRPTATTGPSVGKNVSARLGHYVLRPNDQAILESVLGAHADPLVTVVAPPRYGKTHLLRIVRDRCVDQGIAVSYVPLSVVDPGKSFNARSFIEALLLTIAHGFGWKVSDPKLPRLSPVIPAFFDALSALAGSTRGVILIDGDDAFVDYSGNSFAAFRMGLVFDLLRNWHGPFAGATQPNITIVLVTSSNPNWRRPDHYSPFNFFYHKLQELTRDECTDVCGDRAEHIFPLTSGHPGLTMALANAKYFHEPTPSQAFEALIQGRMRNFVESLSEALTRNDISARAFDGAGRGLKPAQRQLLADWGVGRWIEKGLVPANAVMTEIMKRIPLRL